MIGEPETPDVGIISILIGVLVFVGLGIFLVQLMGPLWGGLALVVLAIGESRGWFDD